MPEHFLMEPLSTGQRVFEYQTDVKNVSLWSNCANKALDT